MRGMPSSKLTLDLVDGIGRGGRHGGRLSRFEMPSLYVALPSIQHGLHFTLDSLQWVVNGYTLTFGGFLLLGGRVADLLGRRRLFIVGLILFSVASLFDGLAQNSGMLIAARALQGIGAAFLSPAALSLLTTNFPESGERTRALGVWSAISAGGGAVGLLAGGILTSALSWQWIFFVNVPIGALAVLAALRYIPESKLEVLLTRPTVTTDSNGRQVDLRERPRQNQVVAEFVVAFESLCDGVVAHEADRVPNLRRRTSPRCCLGLVCHGPMFPLRRPGGGHLGHATGFLSIACSIEEKDGLGDDVGGWS